LFPINFIQYANLVYRQNAEELLRQCRAKDVGVMIIKSICRGPWNEEAGHIPPGTGHSMTLKYPEGSQFCALAGCTGLCTAGDVSVLPKVLDGLPELLLR